MLKYILYIGGLYLIYRKLIKFGNSSHVISVPRYWLKKHNLDKGSTIFIEENGDNELILSAKKDKKQEQKETTIDSKNKSIREIKAEIMGAYVNNYTTIKITGNLKGIKKEIEGLLQNLLALEIMEQTSKKMIIKDFLNINDISIKEIIRRQDIILRSMLTYLKNSLKKDCLEDLVQLDQGINKLRFLSYRVLVNALKNPEVLRIIDIENYPRLLHYWLLVSNIEELSDEFKRSVRIFPKAKLKSKEIKELEKIYSELESDYLEIMKSFYTKHKKMAREIASQEGRHIKTYDELFKDHSNKFHGVIIEKIKHMEIIIRSLARTVINMELEEEKQENLGQKNT